MKQSYKFYTNNENLIVAVSSYAGKTVKGKAKCNPSDVFSEEIGKQLAAARCNLKISDLRAKRAVKRVNEAEQALLAAQRHYDKMYYYYNNALKNQCTAKRELDDMKASI